MNYICQMNAFWRWRRDHELPASAQLLWYTLTAEQNHRRWTEEFELSVTAVRALMGGVSINTFRRARDILVQCGLLEVKMAAHGSAVSRFRLKQLYMDKTTNPPTNPPADPLTDRSTDPLTPPPTAKQQAPPPAPKPNTLNPKNKTTGRDTDDQGNGNGLAKAAGQIPAIRGGGSGSGSSRRGVDWERESSCGL
ncbi:MAG: hypothetical protein AB9917_09150 [Negativicutes bacterium]